MEWHKIPSLAWLRSFEATARCGSFSEAARELNVTHAAIAQNVRALEDFFGEALAIRQGRGMVLTQHGASLAQGLQDGFSTIADSVDELRSHTENRPIVVSLTPAFANSWLMPRLGSFWIEHPEIVVNLNPSSRNVDMARDGIDLAIRFGDGNFKGLSSEFLTNGDLVVVSHPDLMEGRTGTSLRDLEDFTWLFESLHNRERTLLVRDHGVTLDPSKVNVLPSTSLVFSAVEAKLGVAPVPRALARDRLKRGDLLQVGTLKRDGLGYHLVTRIGRETPALATFKKWLRRMAKEEAAEA